ncbi:MAG: hypothetical protein J7639_29305 [Paenibacillaceae bacterium]|nr:hypothetical protein [Paenibacillaceae bacterium]
MLNAKFMKLMSIGFFPAVADGNALVLAPALCWPSFCLLQAAAVTARQPASNPKTIFFPLMLNPSA